MPSDLSSIHFILQFGQDEDPCSVFRRFSPIIPLSSADINILLSETLRITQRKSASKTSYGFLGSLSLLFRYFRIELRFHLNQCGCSLVQFIRDFYSWLQLPNPHRGLPVFQPGDLSPEWRRNPEWESTIGTADLLPQNVFGSWFLQTKCGRAFLN